MGRDSLLDQPVQTPTSGVHWRRVGLRVLGVLLVLGANLLYIPINRTLSGGVSVQLPIDRLIPLWPVWAVPYVLALVWWLSALIWGAARLDDRRFTLLVTAALIMVLSSDIVYVLFPTYVERPELVGEGWAMGLMRMIYSTDRSYCALPSGHTYNTTLIALIWWPTHPRLRWYLAASVLVVILATWFTRQHNLLDAVFGLLWALGSYLIASRIVAQRSEADAP